jgi:hypothetical protein
MKNADSKKACKIVEFESSNWRLERIVIEFECSKVRKGLNRIGKYEECRFQKGLQDSRVQRFELAA